MYVASGVSQIEIEATALAGPAEAGPYVRLKGSG
jgi:hypothetical protein